MILFQIKEEASKSIRKIGADLLGRSGDHQVTLRGEYKKAYSRWSRWTMCTKSCTTQRYRYFSPFFYSIVIGLLWKLKENYE